MSYVTFQLKSFTERGTLDITQAGLGDEGRNRLRPESSEDKHDRLQKGNEETEPDDDEDSARSRSVFSLRGGPAKFETVRDMRELARCEHPPQLARLASRVASLVSSVVWLSVFIARKSG